MDNSKHSMKIGAYGNSFIYFDLNAGYSPEQISQIVTQNMQKNTKSAVFVEFYETEGFYINVLITLGLKFHSHSIEPTTNRGVFAYYIWTNKSVEDKVPSYASSIEGAGAIVLSPDAKKFLLVLERGKWKCVSGAVSPGELAIETIIREIKEETQLTTDDRFKPVYLGGWNTKKARNDLINDHFSMFVLKAKDINFKVDGFEVKDAVWIPIEQGLALLKSNDGVDGGVLTKGKTKYDQNSLLFMQNYTNGRYLDVKERGKKTFFM